MKIKFQNGVILKKGLFLTYLSHFVVTRESYKNSFSTYLTHIHVFWPPYWLCLPYQFWKKYKFIRYGFSLVWFLVLILICAILEQSVNTKMVRVGMSTTDIYTNVKFIVICKPQTLIDRGEDSVKYRNRKKHCFLAATILLFIGKIIITW